MKCLARTDKQNKGQTVAAALSFHKPPENKVYKFLCHGWIHNSWPVMKLKTMWISSKYSTKHHENSSIYELMQLISNSPIISIKILFSHLHCFLDLFFLLTSYPTKNCVFWVVLLCFTSWETLLLFQTQLILRLKWSDKVVLSASGMKNWRNSQSNHCPNSCPSLPDKLQRWSPLYISTQSLYLYRGNLEHTFRCTFPKAPWPLIRFLSAPPSLEGLLLSGLHRWRQTDISETQMTPDLIGTVCMPLYTQSHTAQILPTRSKKIFLSQRQLKFHNLVSEVYLCF